MRYHVLAADYDGTLALHGSVQASTVDSLKTLKASGRLLILVTGRELDELKSIFPEWQLFDRIVAENGALLYTPATLEEKLLGEAPPAAFIDELIKREVMPLSEGRVIVATWEPHQAAVLDVIKQSGIERQVIFNKGAIMILPPGINKATGLKTALDDLQLSIHNVAAIGDAENDSAMLQAAACAVVVANALPALKELADWITPADHGPGVEQLIAHMLEDDLEFLDPVLQRHYLLLGDRYDGNPFSISPHGKGILLTGTSGGGKSTFTASFIESLLRSGRQFCLVDPEGDHEANLEGVVTVGDTTHPPVMDELMALLQKPGQSVNVCTLALTMEEKPGFLQQLLAALQPLIQRKGRPHWLLFDEAHHLAPVTADPGFFTLPQHFRNYVLITTNPALIHRAFLENTDLVITVGDNPEEAIRDFTSALELTPPVMDPVMLQKGEALVWEKAGHAAPFLLRLNAPSKAIQRHKRKYSRGDMGPDSFYFTGPGKKLNLKANNLNIFMQMADGVDNDTWMFHLKRHDYSTWIKADVNDEELARLVYGIEEKEEDPGVSRKKIRKLIEERYTGPE